MAAIEARNPTPRQWIQRRGARALRTVVLAGLFSYGSSYADSQAPQTIARVKPSIVAISTYRATRVPPYRFLATGFAVGDGTLVATNAHVVPPALEAGQDPEVLVALLPSDDTRAGVRTLTVLASDPQHDLAVLKLEGPALRALALRDSISVREGEELLFTGFPLGAGLGLFPATHRAMVAAIAPVAMPSASGKELDATVVNRLRSTAFPIFQLDVTAFPGNSGSPLYDPVSGDVVGVVNLVFVRASREANLERPSGISYAIPSRHLIELLARVNR